MFTDIYPNTPHKPPVITSDPQDVQIQARRHVKLQDVQIQARKHVKLEVTAKRLMLLHRQSYHGSKTIPGMYVK